MVTRTATLDYRATGAGTAANDVVRLTDAISRQEQRANALSPALQKTAQAHGLLRTVVAASVEDVNRLAGGMGPLALGLSQVAGKAVESAQGLGAFAANAERASAASRVLNTASGLVVGGLVAGAAAAVASAHRLIEMGDAYVSLAAKAKIYTTSTMQASEVTEKLFAGARDARSSAEGEAQLFSRLAPAVKDAGRTPEDAVNIATLVNKAMTIQGATGQEATYGAIDLIHALSMGTLQGRQLRGLETEAPVLMRYIAENLQGPDGKIGVAYGSLRNMASAGKINSNAVIEALMRAQPQIEKDFENAPKTASQGWQILNDKIMQTVGQLATVSGAQQGVFNWLSRLTDQADKFRQKMLLDPKAGEGIQAIGQFVGDALGGLGQLGSVVVHNFDLIVEAGRLIIALKLGEVVSSWFANAASASREFLGDLATFPERARLAAGAQAAPATAQAALAQKSAAQNLAARATDLAAQADVKAASAAAARTAADKAVAQAEALRAAESRARANADQINSERTSAGLVEEAAAQRRLGEAAAERAALEEEAARRSTAAAAARGAGQGALALSQGGVGPAGRLYGQQALQDATAAMRYSDQELAVRIQRLKDIEVAEAAAANTAATSAERRAAAETAAAEQTARAEALAAEAKQASAAAAEQEALASRLETQAAAAQTAAANAQGAAAARAAVALEAETAVVAEVTLAETAAAAATTVLNGAMALLGGPVGLAAIAIGALVYAMWQAKAAHDAEIQAMRDQVVITNQLASVTQALTAATWSQIPALQARAKALRDNAAAAQAKNEQDLKAAKADLDRLKQRDVPGLGTEDKAALDTAISLAKGRVRDLGGVVAAGRADANSRSIETLAQSLTVNAKANEQLAERINSGKSESGVPLSAQQIAALKSQLATNAGAAADQVRFTSQQLAAATTEGAKKLWGDAHDAALSALRATDLPGAPVDIEGKPKKPHARGDVDTALRQALNAVEQENTWSPDMWRLANGQHSFSASPSQNTVFDTTTGKPFEAIGPDQAKAAQEYLNAVREIEKAKPAELEKFAPGMTKDQLLAAVQAFFQYKLATSAAVKSDQEWENITQRLGLATEQETSRVRQLTNALKERERAGFKKPADAPEKLARAAILDNADQQRRAVAAVQPIWDQNFSAALEARPKPERLGSRDLNIEAERERVLQAMAEANAETVARIRSDADEKAAGADAEQRKQIEEEAQRQIGAIVIASRLRTNAELAKIDHDEAVNRIQREQEVTDQIAGDFKRAVLSGNFSDLGQSIADEFLSAIYDELIANPIHDMIRSVVRSILHPDGGGGGIGSLFSSLNPFSWFSGGGGGDTFDSTALAEVRDGRVPGFAHGRIPGFKAGRLDRGFIIRGVGGPRSDSNLAWVSDQESIINARSTRKHAALLDAINRDSIPAYADGVVPAGRRGAGAGGDVSISIHNHGAPLSAKVSDDGHGGIRADLYTAVAKPALEKAWSDGSMGRMARRSPEPVKTRA